MSPEYPPKPKKADNEERKDLESLDLVETAKERVSDLSQEAAETIGLLESEESRGVNETTDEKKGIFGALFSTIGNMGSEMGKKAAEKIVGNESGIRELSEDEIENFENKNAERIGKKPERKERAEELRKYGYIDQPSDPESVDTAFAQREQAKSEKRRVKKTLAERLRSKASGEYQSEILDARKEFFDAYNEFLNKKAKGKEDGSVIGRMKMRYLGDALKDETLPPEILELKEQYLELAAEKKMANYGPVLARYKRALENKAKNNPDFKMLSDEEIEQKVFENFKKNVEVREEKIRLTHESVIEAESLKTKHKRIFGALALGAVGASIVTGNLSRVVLALGGGLSVKKIGKNLSKQNEQKFIEESTDKQKDAFNLGKESEEMRKLIQKDIYSLNARQRRNLAFTNTAALAAGMAAGTAGDEYLTNNFGWIDTVNNSVADFAKAIPGFIAGKASSLGLFISEFSQPAEFIDGREGVEHPGKELGVPFEKSSGSQEITEPGSAKDTNPGYKEWKYQESLESNTDLANDDPGYKEWQHQQEQKTPEMYTIASGDTVSEIVMKRAGEMGVDLEPKELLRVLGGIEDRMAEIGIPGNDIDLIKTGSEIDMAVIEDIIANRESMGSDAYIDDAREWAQKAQENRAAALNTELAGAPPEPPVYGASGTENTVAPYPPEMGTPLADQMRLSTPELRAGVAEQFMNGGSILKNDFESLVASGELVFEGRIRENGDFVFLDNRNVQPATFAESAPVETRTGVPSYDQTMAGGQTSAGDYIESQQVDTQEEQPFDSRREVVVPPQYPEQEFGHIYGQASSETVNDWLNSLNKNRSTGYASFADREIWQPIERQFPFGSIENMNPDEMKDFMLKNLLKGHEESYGNFREIFNRETNTYDYLFKQENGNNILLNFGQNESTGAKTVEVSMTQADNTYKKLNVIDTGDQRYNLAKGLQAVREWSLVQPDAGVEDIARIVNGQIDTTVLENNVAKILEQVDMSNLSSLESDLPQEIYGNIDHKVSGGNQVLRFDVTDKTYNVLARPDGTVSLFDITARNAEGAVDPTKIINLGNFDSESGRENLKQAFTTLRGEIDSVKL